MPASFVSAGGGACLTVPMPGPTAAVSGAVLTERRRCSVGDRGGCRTFLGGVALRLQVKRRKMDRWEVHRRNVRQRWHCPGYTVHGSGAGTVEQEDEHEDERQQSHEDTTRLNDDPYPYRFLCGHIRQPRSYDAGDARSVS